MLLSSQAIAGQVPITFGQIYIGEFQVGIGIGQVTKPQKMSKRII